MIRYNKATGDFEKSGSEYGYEVMTVSPKKQMDKMRSALKELGADRISEFSGGQMKTYIYSVLDASAFKREASAKLGQFGSVYVGNQKLT